MNEYNQKSRNYTSFKQYYDDTYKHRRKEIAPNQIFKSPITYNQNYGFYNFQVKELNELKYPKRKCEETKYAEAIIMTGKEFMK